MTTTTTNQPLQVAPGSTFDFRKANLADYLAVDTEASGEDVRDGRGYAIGISLAYRFGDRTTAEYFPFRHRFGDNAGAELLDQLRDLIESHDCLIFHNAKFDLASLATAGIRPQGKFYDTMLMGQLINENLMSKSLEYMGQHYLKEGKVRDDDEFNMWKKHGWANIPEDIMAPYAKQDADLTLRLFERIYPDFCQQGFDGDYWNVEQRFVRLLYKMESRGILIDRAACTRQAALGRSLMEEISNVLGFTPAGKELENYLLNTLNLPVVRTTEGGKPSFNKDAMAAYDSMLAEMGNSDAQRVVAYRGWQKSCAVAYEGYPLLVSPDGRLRPNYNMHRVDTGRLSCSQPNLQQIPRVSQKAWDGALKSLFIPADGYELWEADYSQLELRLGAAYAGEQSLIAEFAKPESDVFSRMAAELGFTRHDTKTLTYTLQYGGGINRISTVFKVDAGRAAEIRDRYFETYPGFRSISQKASRTAKKRGYVKTWSGRRRHFDDVESQAHKSFNAVIQGGAAEIVKHTMLRLEKEVDCDDCKMLLQVHDSVVFEIKSEKIDEYKSRIKACMEAVEPDFGVKFAVDVKPWDK